MNRYQYYFTKNKVICVSHYAGRTVRGVAKCAPNDEFNEEFGKTLARLRCDVKVAELRYKRADALLVEADRQFDEADALLAKREDYFQDSESALDDACIALEDFLSGQTE